MASDFREPRGPTWRMELFPRRTLPVQLGPLHWTLLQGRGRPVDIAARRALITQFDDTDDSVFVLLTGHVLVERSDGGHPTGLRICGPGDVLGELAAWTGQVRSATVRACGPVTALRVEREAWRGFFHEQPGRGAPDPARPRLTALVNVLTHKLDHREKWLLDCRTRTAPTTAARLLVELAERYPDESAQRAGRLRCVLPFEEADLAALADVAPKTMQSALRTLRERDLIAFQAPTTILDEAGLNAVARWPAHRRSVRGAGCAS